MRDPFSLGPLPAGLAMETVDERIVRADIAEIFDLARRVEQWPAYLGHYRFVRFRERASDGGGIVEMSANRPFGPLNWPTWWLSQMSVDASARMVRFRHIGGMTTRMEVAWSFHSLPESNDTLVRLVHVWDGPHWPLIGAIAATAVIGPVFVHGIASRTLEGLARIAEQHLGPPVGTLPGMDPPSALSSPTA